MSDLGGVLGNQSIGEQMQEEPREPVTDEERAALPGEPPVEGAQWDELHQRWEHWDEATRTWQVVGGPGVGEADPAKENPLPPLLARELHVAEELEAEDGPAVPDVEREPEPDAGPPGAQWNEVLARWERWDDASGAWVEATDEPSEG
jgi:hypothetical protein